MKDGIIDKLLEVGIALSSQKNPDILFQTIVEAAMDIVNCDGGTLYIVDKQSLEFKVMITRSQNIKKGGTNGEITLPPVPLMRENVCARAAIDREIYRIDNVYEDHNFDFSGPRKYDAMTGYKTRSMLVVPMEDDKGNIIGVIQFINAIDDSGEISTFTEMHQDIVRSLASQAAICLTNHNYAKEITKTLDSMVEVLTTSIDARTPYNALHTRNMAKYAKNFLQWMNETGKGFPMDEKESRRFIMAVHLHDVGKLVTPLEVMNKATRLDGEETRIYERLSYVKLLKRVSMLEGRLSKEEYTVEIENLEKIEKLVAEINAIGFLNDQLFDELYRISKETYLDVDNIEKPILTEKELENLSVRKGTLTAEERITMENHVVLTDRILREMHFPKEDSMIPDWAADHHETLDGTGYPKKKKAEELCKEVRLLTILDIFDALTATDRPYKVPMPVEKALSILDTMAEKEGKLDVGILKLFKESRAWE